MSAIAVPPLLPADAAALATLVADCRAAHSPRIDSATIARASGGNPLFIRELVRHQSLVRPTDDLPTSLRDLMEARLSTLDLNTLRLLRVVALLGSDAFISRVVQLVPIAPHDVSERIEWCERNGVLMLCEPGHLALHDCWQEAVADQLVGATRAALAHECALSLEADASENPSADTAWNTALLFELAGERITARAAFERCGEHLLLSGLAAQAYDAFHRARQLADSDGHRLTLSARMSLAAHQVGAFDASLDSARDVLRLEAVGSQRLSSLALQARVHLTTALWRLGRPHTDALNALAIDVRSAGIPDSELQLACLSALRLAFNDATSELQSVFYETSVAATQRSGVSLAGQLVALIYCAERGTSDQVRSIASTIGALERTPEDSSLEPLSLRIRSHALRWVGDHSEAIALATRGFDLAVKIGLPDEAAGFAHQLAFQHLDECEDELAEDWLSRGDRVLGTQSSPSRELSSVHARARILIQRGLFRPALNLYRRTGDSPTEDPVLKRGITDLATVGYAASKCGAAALAQRNLARTIQVLETEAPTRLLDYPAELVVRTYAELGLEEQGDEFGRRYLSRRIVQHARPIPKFCHKLRQLEP